MKNKLEKKISQLLSWLGIIVLLPLVITIICQGMRLDSLIKALPIDASFDTGTPGTDMAAATESLSSESTPEYAPSATESPEALSPGKAPAAEAQAADSENPSAGESVMDTASASAAEERVMGIVAREISMGSNTQALLAQCVIARTSLYDAQRTHTAEPDAYSPEEMQELWGEDYEKVARKLRDCVAQTAGEILTYRGHPVYAAYHAISAGSTRNMAELYADADMPYLKEYPCTEDAAAEGYLAVLYQSKNEFLENCRSLFPESPPESPEQVRIISRDSAGYVLEIAVGENSFSGEEFRTRMGLKSACFTLTESGDQIRIVTKGLGHGFGLSQYSANLMAAEGKTYREILSCFYPGTELKDMRE